MRANRALINQGTYAPRAPLDLPAVQRYGTGEFVVTGAV